MYFTYILFYGCIQLDFETDFTLPDSIILTWQRWPLIHLSNQLFIYITNVYASSQWLCLQSVLESIYRFHYRRLAFCSLPLATILESPLLHLIMKTAVDYSAAWKSPSGVLAIMRTQYPCQDGPFGMLPAFPFFKCLNGAEVLQHRKQWSRSNSLLTQTLQTHKITNCQIVLISFLL
jgi:hypothetical protein